jgi:hypothetical protein
MRPKLALALSIAFCACACTKQGEENGQRTPPMGWMPWVKREEALISTLEKRQDASLVRLAQQRAIEKAAAEQAAAELAAVKRAQKRKSGLSRRVPPSMYRTTEPPLPEPDFSLPVQEVPRSSR